MSIAEWFTPCQSLRRMWRMSPNCPTSCEKMTGRYLAMRRMPTTPTSVLPAGQASIGGVALKARPKFRLGSSQKQRNRKHSSIRSRVEHLFRVIQCQFGYTKVRYKGLAKNAAQVFMLVGLANLYLKRRALLA